ncbi:MAG: UDP-3-O-(3-hydroxymyristoyl)glucosamine N-acyltransferase [Dongiaceae bacterium]
MADPRFFTRAGPFTLAELAKRSNAALSSAADPERQFIDVAPLDEAGPDQVSFLDNPKYLDAFLVSQAGACVVSPGYAGKAPPAMDLLIAKEPYKAYALIAQAFYPPETFKPGIDKTALIDPSAKIGKDCYIGAYVVIGAKAEIGARCRIEAQSTIGPGVVIGDECVVGVNSTITHAIIGKRSIIYTGVRIGQSGFGFAPDAQGPVKVPQLGRVIIGDDVEVGANAAIDRGSAGDTVIGPGCMIDNLVQIGHNVKLGRGCVVVAQVGIAGSTILEDYVMLGGQAGIAGHIKLGRGAKVAGKSGVMRDVEPGAAVGGIPAVSMRQWHRQTAAVQHLINSKKPVEE